MPHTGNSDEFTQPRINLFDRPFKISQNMVADLTAESLGAPVWVEKPPAKAKMSSKEIDEAWYLHEWTLRLFSSGNGRD